MAHAAPYTVAYPGETCAACATPTAHPGHICAYELLKISATEILPIAQTGKISAAHVAHIVHQ